MNDQELRKWLVWLLEEGGAHASFEQATKGLAPRLQGVKPAGLPHSAWQLLEHLRLAQWDILEFSRNPKHVSPKWPEGYWPKSEKPPKSDSWAKSVKSFLADRRAMVGLIKKADLFTPFAHGDGQNLLREALLLADHNAYHIGELVLLRRALGAWK